MPVIYYAYYTPVSDRIPDISAQEHALGRRLLRLGLNELFGYSLPADHPDLPLETDANGKPYLPDRPDICFNISHCHGLAVCAFNTRPVGVDAELPGYFAEILISRALSDSEKSFLQEAGTTPALRQEWFYRLWTLKEAYVKRSGCGVDINLTKFSFSFTIERKEMHVRCSDSLVTCYQEQLPGGHIISLCYSGTETSVTLLNKSF